MVGHTLAEKPIHLGRGARAHIEPAFTGMEWYGDYIARHGSDGVEGRLVSMYTFTDPWTSWEMHPAGDEVVLCTAGRITLHQEWADGRTTTETIEAGEYAINPPGVWHTADIARDLEGGATVVFVTAGWGTEHRPR